jgi:hypothetical protein
VASSRLGHRAWHPNRARSTRRLYCLARRPTSCSSQTVTARLCRADFSSRFRFAAVESDKKESQLFSHRSDRCHSHLEKSLFAPVTNVTGLGSCGSRLSWLWGEGVPSRVARGAPNSAGAVSDCAIRGAADGNEAIRRERDYNRRVTRLRMTSW